MNDIPKVKINKKTTQNKDLFLSTIELWNIDEIFNFYWLHHDIFKEKIKNTIQQKIRQELYIRHQNNIKQANIRNKKLIRGY